MGDALQYTSETCADGFVEIPRDNLMQLDEEVRKALVVRETCLKAAEGATFRGTSLCVKEKEVAKISRIFKDIARPMI
jgi:hypothetical protein